MLEHFKKDIVYNQIKTTNCYHANETSLVHNILSIFCQILFINFTGISQPPSRGPVPGPDINYTGPREVLLEFVILVS
jgi:hypothetical protein